MRIKKKEEIYKEIGSNNRFAPIAIMTTGGLIGMGIGVLLSKNIRNPYVAALINPLSGSLGMLGGAIAGTKYTKKK